MASDVHTRRFEAARPDPAYSFERAGEQPVEIRGLMVDHDPGVGRFAFSLSDPRGMDLVGGIATRVHDGARFRVEGSEEGDPPPLGDGNGETAWIFVRLPNPPG